MNTERMSADKGKGRGWCGKHNEIQWKMANSKCIHA
jgi:hypothetical protein